MFKKVKPKEIQTTRGIVTPTVQFPHCDQRILHAPGECEFCDKHPDWQFLRQMWGISFTGYTPEQTELPCPADNARGDNHKNWPGNTAAKPIQFHNHLGGKRSGCPACAEEKNDN